MDFLRMALCAVIAYLLGNIQTGLIVGRLLNNEDLRKHGSGNTGATNALRVLGRKQALITLVGDALKGMLAVGVGYLVVGRQGGMVAAVFVVVGHIWPVFFGFKGGKGAATALGVLAVLMPWHTLLLAAIGVVVLAITKMVSMASLCGAAVFLISGVITSIMQQDWFQLVFVIVMSGLIIFAHRGNIVRILKGNENQITKEMFRR